MEELRARASYDGYQLGHAQQIEAQMSHDVGVKVFRIQQGSTQRGYHLTAREFDMEDADEIELTVRAWMDAKVRNSDEDVLTLKTRRDLNWHN